MTATKQRISLSMQMLIATGIGAAVGIILQLTGQQDFAKTYITPVGKLFLNLIQMVIIPLIFTTLVMGIYRLGDLRKYGRMGIKTVALFISMAALASFIGLAIGSIFRVGSGVQVPTTGEATVPEPVNMVNVIINFVPANIIKAFAEGAMVSIIVFAIFLGVAMVVVGEKAKPMQDLIESLNDIITKITQWVLVVAPLGIFAIVAETFALNGFKMIGSMLGLILVIYLGFAINNLVVYGGGVGLVGGPKRVVEFYKHGFESFLFAFTAQTSSAAIPFINRSLDRLGVSKAISGFIAPLGSAIHKDGTALYQSVMVVFLANYFGVPMTPAVWVLVIFSATIASIGTAGVPQGGMMTLGMVLVAAGVPIEGVSLVAGLIAIIGMGSTLNNVAGDVATAVIVSDTERETAQTDVNEAADPAKEPALV